MTTPRLVASVALEPCNTSAGGAPNKGNGADEAVSRGNGLAAVQLIRVARRTVESGVGAQGGICGEEAAYH